MQMDIILAHYDPKLPLVLTVDASPTGVGAVLSHVINGVERPIQFASQTLGEVQRKYAHIDKESYAIIYGVRKFYDYLFGNRFTLITDNRAVSQIFSLQKGLPLHSAARMQHYAIFLQQFNYKICYRKSKDNANADALSRLPDKQMYQYVEEVFAIQQEIKRETEIDKEVANLLKCLQYGRNCVPSD